MSLSDIAEGFVQHSAPYSTPPTYDSATLYKFGLYPEGVDLSLDLDLQTQINEQGRYGVHTPTLNLGNTPAEGIASSFRAVNGLPFYWFFGKASIEGADSDTSIKTVVPFTTARKPRLGVFKNTYGDKKNVNGVICSDFAFTFKTGYLECVLGGKGLDWGSNSYTPSSWAFPKDGSSNEIDTPYNVLSTLSIEPSGGDLTNLTCIENSFSFQGKQGLGSSLDSDGYYKDLSEFGNKITGVYALQVIAANGAALQTAREAGTTCEFIYKFIKSDDSNQYIEATQNVKIRTCKEIANLGDLAIYGMNLVAESYSIDILDKLTHGWYS